MASRYAHAKQFKRHHRQLRLLRSRLGRIIRDIRRKITGRPELEAVFEAPIARAAQIRSQRQRQRGWKLYSFHAPRSNASSMKGCGSSGCRRAEVRSGSRLCENAKAINRDRTSYSFKTVSCAHIASAFNFEIEIKNIVLVALRTFEFSHRLGHEQTWRMRGFVLWRTQLGPLKFC